MSGTKLKLWSVTDLEGDGCSGPIFLGIFQASTAKEVQEHIRMTHDLPDELVFDQYYEVEVITPIVVEAGT